MSFSRFFIPALIASTRCVFVIGFDFGLFLAVFTGVFFAEFFDVFFGGIVVDCLLLDKDIKYKCAFHS
jgi:hypothetical protein